MTRSASVGIARTDPPHAAERRVVMIVDDDPAVLRAMNELVAEWGFSVVRFSNFEDARAYLAANTPDALLVDVRLGMFNGLQLVHLAKQVDPTMIVVAMSGFDDTVIRAEATSVGAVYMIKPLNLEELRRQLQAPDIPAADRV
jgi:DNA-binding response OmpR family regulator